MMVTLASCMTSTFMVIFRNASAFSFIYDCCLASARKSFSSFSPCTLSRNTSPIAVYSPQYLANTRLAKRDTIMIDMGISGTQASSTTATRQLIKTQMPNSKSGESIA